LHPVCDGQCIYSCQRDAAARATRQGSVLSISCAPFRTLDSRHCFFDAKHLHISLQCLVEQLRNLVSNLKCGAIMVLESRTTFIGIVSFALSQVKNPLAINAKSKLSGNKHKIRTAVRTQVAVRQII
jgi:hypothetical protein